jgi:hypothetical protein
LGDEKEWLEMVKRYEKDEELDEGGELDEESPG